MIARFADDERGGFFTTSHDHEQLIARRKDLGDHPIPSGNASAASACSAWPRSPATPTTRSAPSGPSGCSPLRPAATQTPSATCSRHSTSTSRRRGRWRWSRPPRARRPPPSPTSAAWCTPPIAPTSYSRAAPRAPSAPSCCRDRPAVEGEAGRLRLRALRLQGARDRARRARGAPAGARGTELGTAVAEAALWGLAGASSLLIGAVLGARVAPSPAHRRADPRLRRGHARQRGRLRADRGGLFSSAVPTSSPSGSRSVPSRTSRGPCVAMRATTAERARATLRLLSGPCSTASPSRS